MYKVSPVTIYPPTRAGVYPSPWGLSANLGFIRQPRVYPPTRPWGTGWWWGWNVKPLSVPQENPCTYPRVSAIRGNPYVDVMLNGP